MEGNIVFPPNFFTTIKKEEITSNTKKMLDKIKEIEAKAGNRNYQFGKVIVNGYGKVFTSIVRDPSTYTIRYGDAKIICKGDIRKIRYTEPS